MKGQLHGQDLGLLPANGPTNALSSPCVAGGELLSADSWSFAQVRHGLHGTPSPSRRAHDDDLRIGSQRVRVVRQSTGQGRRSGYDLASPTHSLLNGHHDRLVAGEDHPSPAHEPTCATAAFHSSLASAASSASRESKLRIDSPSQPADFRRCPRRARCAASDGARQRIGHLGVLATPPVDELLVGPVLGRAASTMRLYTVNFLT